MAPGLSRHAKRLVTLAPKVGAFATSRAAVVSEAFDVPYSIVRYDPVSATGEARCDVPPMLLAQLRAAAEHDAMPVQSAH